MSQYRSSLLTIGTEVSSGQIVNTNASWLSDQLTNLHFETVCHVTVPDEEKDILEALDFLAARSDYIIVTGGLGPTRDDITRQVITRWSDDHLQFDEASWQNIQTRFQQLGIAPPESNRQQCFFPSRAKIIPNPKGTANAFCLKKNQHFVCCLPGPPEEIKAIWQKSLEQDLKEMVRDADPYRLFRWQCLGVSESALGEIVEKIIEGSTLVSGYRPHMPYVEIKIWCRQSQIESQTKVFHALDEGLKKWTVVRNEEDIIDAFFARLSSFESIDIRDLGTHGAFAERLGLASSQSKPSSLKISYHGSFGAPISSSPSAQAQLQLIIGPLQDDGSWTIDWKSSEVHRQKTLKLPFRKDLKRWDRERRFVCEMSLAAWAQSHTGELLT